MPGVLAFGVVIDNLRSIYRELYRLLDAAGHGTKGRVQLAAGLGDGFLRNQRGRLLAGRDKGYDISALLRVLEVLGVDCGIFFGRIFGSYDPIALSQLEARELGEPPELVAEVRDFLALEQWQPLGEFPHHVRGLDAHRYHNAREAGGFALTELEKVVAGVRPPGWGVPLLAVYGSVLRMTEEHDDAQQTLVTALEIAERTRDLPALGDLLQRLAYVVADRCADYRRASELALRASDCHFRARDLNSAGKACVDRGLWLHKLGELEEAIDMQRCALDYLPADEHQNRFSAVVGLGIYHRELGDLAGAEDYAQRARELMPEVGPWLVAKLLWLEARIAADRQRYEDAEKLWREVIGAFLPISAGEAALATTELVRVLVLQDRAGEAHETATTMAQFIIPLEEQNPFVAATVLDLLRRGEAGRGISIELIDRVAGVLEEERTRPKRRARPRR